MHTNATDTHAVPSNVLLPTLDHLKANNSIQKAAAERLSELQHLNSTGMSQKMKSQCGGVEVLLSKKEDGLTNMCYLVAIKNVSHTTS